jgi:protein-tyrosine kinase
MTILEALEKAKKLRETRADVAAPKMQRASTAKVVRRHGTQQDLPPVTAIELPQLALDRAACERNRVLLSTEQAYTFSAMVDAYRILRTRLMQSQGVAGDRGPTFGLTSAGAGEGKTVTSVNLAFACAREKKRNVFLLDLDLRNPSVCRYLGVTPTTEIGDVLLGRARPAEALFGVGVDNLIVSGGLTSYENSSELLGGPGLSALLDHIFAADPQALIIADLPPVLLAADALTVTPHLSAVVLVVSEGHTRRVQLTRAVEVLSDVKIAGIVLNRSRESVEDYYS